MRRFLALTALVLGSLPYAAHAQDDGDPKAGQEFAETHCARCHVISPERPYGGIGSTPSFPLLATMKDYKERFQSFYDRRPHPVFARMENVEKWADLPSPVAEFDVSAKDIDDIMAFIETIKEE